MWCTRLTSFGAMQERDSTAQELEELITQMESLIQAKDAAEQQVILVNSSGLITCRRYKS